MADSPTALAAAPSSIGAAGSPPEYQVIVLLVDDQAMVGEAVRRALATEKTIEFHYCADPSAAVDLARRIHPTVILLDLVMPTIDGITLVKTFRANPDTKITPIIVLSTTEEPKIKAEAFAVGANDYVVKLPDKLELVARIVYHSRAYLDRLRRDELEEALRRQATHDALTGVLNRGAILDLLDRELNRARREHLPIAVILADLDRFKSINDGHGHQAGDAVLCEAARRMAASVRAYDGVGRYGGEEFLIVLPGCQISSAGDLAERVRASVEAEPVRLAEGSIPVTMSLGVASCAGSGPASRDADLTDSHTAAALLRAADIALYAAKDGGRNRVVLADAPAPTDGSPGEPAQGRPGPARATG